MVRDLRCDCFIKDLSPSPLPCCWTFVYLNLLSAVKWQTNSLQTSIRWRVSVECSLPPSWWLTWPPVMPPDWNTLDPNTPCLTSALTKAHSGSLCSLHEGIYMEALLTVKGWGFYFIIIILFYFILFYLFIYLFIYLFFFFTPPTFCPYWTIISLSISGFFFSLFIMALLNYYILKNF